MTTESLTVNEHRLEWGLAVAATVGGTVVVVAALGYGLTNATGVGAGFVPTVAGGLRWPPGWRGCCSWCAASGTRRASWSRSDRLHDSSTVESSTQ